jgi:hypothetical protein
MTEFAQSEPARGSGWLTLKHLWEGVGYSENDPEKRDYTTPKRMILISLIAMAIGVGAAVLGQVHSAL